MNPAERVQNLLTACLLVAAVLAPQPAVAAPAARVEFAVGNPEIASAGGAARPLAKGAAVEAGDTVFTNDGRVQLRFTDGAYVSLQPQSQFRVDDYRWEGRADGSERGFFSLLRGGLRTITGVVGRSNKRNYRVSTTVATIGIRGTEYKISPLDGGIVGSIGEGAIEVCTGAGCFPFTSGESFLVSDPDTQPQFTDKQVDLPPPPGGFGPGSVFGENNDSTKNPGGSPLLSGNETDASGAPVGLLLTGPQVLDGVIAGSIASFRGGVVQFDDAGAVVQLPGKTSAGLLDVGFGNDGFSAWGAFKDTAGAVVHYAVGMPVDIAPKVATYSLTGATLPTDALGNPVGILQRWDQTVDFVNATGAASAEWKLQGVPFSADLSGTFDGALNMAGLCSGNPCSVNAQGLPFGPGAKRFGVAYQISASLPPAPTRAAQPSNLSAIGSAVLTQTGSR
ncbi:MAG TPA: FecR family protein [Burkholderiales bacterium]|jgi:hypothetical protein